MTNRKHDPEREARTAAVVGGERNGRPDGAVAAQDERAAFEAWIESKTGARPTKRFGQFAPATDLLWQGWQAALAQARSEWRPIATLPKDATEDVLWTDGRFVFQDPADCILGALRNGNATHWMPLPTPPVVPPPTDDLGSVGGRTT